MRSLFAIALFAVITSPLSAAGLLIPEDRKVPPLAMVSHRVNAVVEDQVGISAVEQIFRNHTDRPLEATYLFPVPKGASVDKFTMWIDGKETAGELLDAKKAHQIYTDIVRRTLDPGLLEYVGTDLLKLRVFPVPPRGDVKVKVRYSAIAPKDHGVVEFTYPMRTDGKATRTLEDFSVKITLKSQHPIATIYSPTHAISIARPNSREAVVEFEKKQALLDKDFQLFYGVSDKEVGLTPIVYRPISSEDGYFMLAISPEIEAAKSRRVPRDMVMVIDTSGSMSDVKMEQARKALKHCLNNLHKDDRFALLSFATVVNTFRDELSDTGVDYIEKANKWVDDLRQSGGTAILPALTRALEYRSKDAGRPFTVVFFTDGMPTVDETDPVKIVKAIAVKNSADTRIFTFGVGDDVNAAMLDQLSESTKAVSTYVRPSEDIEAKVSVLHNKISRPVLTNVKLTSTNVTLKEIYPPAMPDLFFGSQLVVFGRYAGQGPAAIKLTGQVGSETKEFVYELTFPAKTETGKDFVEHLWARRKVGFLLDQIRINGESKELVDEATKLAKRYGIATPYTSYLVVPDGPMPVAERGRADLPVLQRAALAPPGFTSGLGGLPATAATAPTGDVARRVAAESTGKADGLAGSRGEAQNKAVDEALKQLKPEERRGAYADALAKVQKDAKDNESANRNYKGGNLTGNQIGTLGVDLACASNQLRNQDRLSLTANYSVQGRNCVEVGGVWIDDQFNAKMPMLAVKAQSDAYFRFLEKRPEIKEVFKLGNHLVWVCPNGTALVIDAREGKSAIEDAEIDKLFVAKK
jgi:Ca-activated chloride channel family protein